MSPDTEQKILETLREIREGQKEMLAVAAAHRALAQEQLQKSRASIDESVALQREAVRRARTVTLIAVPGILLCIAAIAYLVLRYFPHL